MHYGSVDTISKAENIKRPRILKTHLSFDMLPKDLRNGKAKVTSFQTHHHLPGLLHSLSEDYTLTVLTKKDKKIFFLDSLKQDSHDWLSNRMLNH